MVVAAVQTSPEAGVVVSAASLVVSLVLVAFLRREARRTRSLALRADAFHYVTDVATNIVAGLALVGYKVLGWRALDPVASILIALYIIWSAFEILRDAAQDLVAGVVGGVDHVHQLVELAQDLAQPFLLAARGDRHVAEVRIVPLGDHQAVDVVAAAAEHLADAHEDARAVVDLDAQVGEPLLTLKLAVDDGREDARIDVAAAEDQADFATRKALRLSRSVMVA